MYISIQNVCSCYGNLLFESLHCDRCHSLIPFQLSDELLIQQQNGNDINNTIANINNKKLSTSSTLFSYNHQQHNAQQSTGRIRFRAMCPFCNSLSFTMRTFCKRERLYYHLRIQNMGQNDQRLLPSDPAALNSGIMIDQYGIKRDQNGGFDDTLSLQTKFNHSQTNINSNSSAYVNPATSTTQIDAERNSYVLNELENDLFTTLKNGLFFDTIIVCQDNIRLQVHRCILGGRSGWFRNLISDYHESNTNDDYVLQINIDDISSEIMSEILNYIYTNRCRIDLKNAQDLLLASKRFELDKLKKQISEFLSYRLTVDNAVDLLICAHESNTLELKQACIRLINRYAEKIKRTDKWNQLKTQYVDLVPELYENRVDPSLVTTFPDVFNKQTGGESFSSLNEVYEYPPKPIQQQQLKALTPLPRTPLGRINNSGPYPTQRNESSLSSLTVMDDLRPAKNWKNADNDNTGKRNKINNNPPKRRSSIRTVFPPVIMTQNTEIDQLRRPVNVHEKSKSLPQTDNRMYSPTRQQLSSPQTSYRAATPAPQSARKTIQLEILRQSPTERKKVARVVKLDNSD